MSHISSSVIPTKRSAHWPRNADFKVISRAEAKALVSEFGALCGLDVLRAHGNFMHMTLSKVLHFDNVDLVTAIQFMIDHLSCEATHVDAERKRHLMLRLEAACGLLNQPIAVMVECSRRTFVPARA